ncbi:MAG TPA: class I SAM-dependent methyltransferase [Sphingomicrobium sp.]|nr:class I SAM-dependent methyltransferase [Sphingomicrobium sp.]
MLRCRYCGHGVTTPPLDDVAFLYEGRESQDYQPDAKGLSAAIKGFAFRLQARKLLNQLPKSPSSILDFGCGSGQFTRVVSQLLPRATVVGADFHAGAPIQLGPIAYKAMKELSGDAGRYELVTAMHVLEHDDDPDSLLAKIAALAKPGGTVVIEVPNVDCIWAKVFGRHWDAWYVPYHRTHFTKASLRRRIEAGHLTVLAIHDVTVPTMGRTCARLAGSRNHFGWLLLGIALHPLQWLGEKLSGRASAIRVIARV